MDIVTIYYIFYGLFIIGIGLTLIGILLVYIYSDLGIIETTVGYIVTAAIVFLPIVYVIFILTMVFADDVFIKPVYNLAYKNIKTECYKIKNIDSCKYLKSKIYNKPRLIFKDYETLKLVRDINNIYK